MPDSTPPAVTGSVRVGIPPQGIGWLLAAVVALVVVAVYFSSLAGGLIADDWAMIDKNAERMRGWAAIERFFTGGVWESSNLGRSDSALYRPVWLMWNFAQYNLFGEDPLWWRVASLALHVVNTLMVATILGALLPGLTRLERAAGALLFALHPAKPQGVAWISGSTDLLLTLFFLAAMLSFLRYRRTGRPLALVATLACYVLAMLTKEPGIVLPAVLLAADLWHRGGERAAARRGSSLAAYGLFGVAAVAFLWLRGAVLGGALQGEAHFAISGETVYRLVEYGVGYLRLLVLPWPMPYYFRHVDGATADALTFVIGAAVLALLAIALWRSRVGRIGGVWLAVSLAAPLVLALHQMGLFGPRFLYLPSVGAVLIAGAAYLWLKARSAALAFGLSSAFVVAFAMVTVTELPNWRDELSWSALTIRSDPTSRYGWAARAEHFMRIGQTGKAVETWNEAVDSVASESGRAILLERLAVTEAQRGRYDESMAAYRRLSEIEGSEAAGFIGIGNVHWVSRRLDKAVEAYDAALSHDPADQLALANRARLGEALGDTKAALTHYRRLLELPEKPAFRDVRAHAERFVRRNGG